VPVPVFCCFSIPDNYLRKYSRNWTKQKPNLLFSRHVHGARRASPGEAHGLLTMSPRGLEGGGATTWWGRLGHPLAPPFRLYNPPASKTLNKSAIFQKEFRSSAAIEDKFRGSEVPVPAPCRDGDWPPEPSPSTPPPPLWLHDGLWVVPPWTTGSSCS
jgi:hypothetical protein